MYQKNLKSNQKVKQETEKKQEQKHERIIAFKDQVAESKDLEDELQNLINYLKDNTESTAVYIGKVVKPKKPISDEDNDTAHKDEGAQPQIQFTNVTSQHEFMVDKILLQEQGITDDLFREEEKKDDEVEEDPEAEAGD